MGDIYLNPISKDIKLNELFFETYLGVGISFDAGKREIKIAGKRVILYYINGLVDTQIIVEILKRLMQINSKDVTFDKIHQNLTHQQVEITKNKDDIAKQVTNGLLGIIVEGENKGFIIDVRSYPGRSPQEPDTERVVRGARDGFVENIIVNTALIRRRVRDRDLRNKIYRIGLNTTTDISITYIEGKTPSNMVKEVEKRLNDIKVEELVMSDKALEELLLDQSFNPYPIVRYTERPDIVASHLYQGQIALIVDTSPSVILLPCTIFDHMTHAEEYRQTPFIGSFMRLVRFGGIFSSLFLIPFWYLFVRNPELLPEVLRFIGPKEFGNIPIILQLYLGEIGIEFLRMAAIHTPSPLTAAMGIIAGILVGQIAIDVGLFSPEVVLYVSVSGIGAYVTPSYELSLANKMSKLFFLTATFFFGIVGLIGSISIWFIYLARIKTFGKGYLYPLYPFNLKELIRIFIRFPKKNKKKRLS